jgi:hypothetical protein
MGQEYVKINGFDIYPCIGHFENKVLVLFALLRLMDGF